MINTSMNSYLQNGAMQKVKPQDQQTNNKNKNTNVNNNNNNNEINLVISKDSKAMLEIDNYQKQLSDIFGTKKELTSSEKETEKELKQEIENINNSESLPYSEEDKKSIKEIHLKIQKILEKPFHEYEDDNKIFDLSREISYIGEQYNEDSAKSEPDSKKEALNKELRTLQGYKDPDVPELLEAGKINKKIDIVKLELELEKLDKNSGSYEADSIELKNKISSAYESIENLDLQKETYKEEEIRETSKSSIETSLTNINRIRDSFVNGNTSSGQNSLSNTSETNTQKENKWLNFLQDSRKEFISNQINSDGLQNENTNIRNIVEQAKTLHKNG